MKKIVLFLFALLLVLSVTCYAGNIEVQDSGVKQGNAVKLNYTGDIACTFDGQDTATITYSDDDWVTEIVTAATDTITTADTKTIYITTSTNSTTDFTLPAAAADLQFRFASSLGRTITVDPASTSDTIKYLGLDAGDAIDSAGTTGDSIELIGATTTWYVIDMGSSAWTDGGAD